MKLKTLTKHLIMQYPSLFPNATAVYDHLFYVIGNGYRWKKGILVEHGFKIKSKLDCINDCIDHNLEFCKNENAWNKKNLIKKQTETLGIMLYKHAIDNIQKEIDIILNAEKLSKDFSIPEEFRFHFYPTSNYSACNNIPDDIKPDWKEGIEKINKIREEYEAKR